MMVARHKHPDHPPFRPEIDDRPSLELEQYFDNARSRQITRISPPNLPQNATFLRRLIEIATGTPEQEALPEFTLQPGMVDADPSLTSASGALRSRQRYALLLRSKNITTECIQKYDSFEESRHNMLDAEFKRRKMQLWKSISWSNRLHERAMRFALFHNLSSDLTRSGPIKSVTKCWKRLLYFFSWEEVVSELPRHGLRCSREITGEALGFPCQTRAQLWGCEGRSVQYYSVKLEVFMREEPLIAHQPDDVEDATWHVVCEFTKYARIQPIKQTVRGSLLPEETRVLLKSMEEEWMLEHERALDVLGRGRMAPNVFHDPGGLSFPEHFRLQAFFEFMSN